MQIQRAKGMKQTLSQSNRILQQSGYKLVKRRAERDAAEVSENNSQGSTTTVQL